uniref:Uncharacterized protein n=1 Tax=Parascaris univalens TaxID=6257 RepID=A0A915A4N2_PARUN
MRYSAARHYSRERNIGVFRNSNYKKSKITFNQKRLQIVAPHMKKLEDKPKKFTSEVFPTTARNLFVHIHAEQFYGTTFALLRNGNYLSSYVFYFPEEWDMAVNMKL